MIKSDLQKSIQQICANLGISREVVLEHPQELAHGDFATSIALSAAKDLKQNPKELAEAIATNIREPADARIADVSVAGPGFINIVLTKQALYQELARITEGYGSNNLHEGKNILVEHSSPNLFKPFHIGHLMNNAIGEAVTRIVKNTGAEVRTMSFPSDVSLGIAKAIFMVHKDFDNWEKLYKEGSIEEKIKYLGNCYIQGVRHFEDHQDDLEKAKQINRILNYVENETISNIFTIQNQVRQVNELYFRNILKNLLDSQIDEFIFESVAGDVGKNIVNENLGKVFKESEGAIIYEPDAGRKDINTSVFINSDRIPTYDAKDLGLLKIKFNREDKLVFDLSIFITDSEQIPHFKVVFDAATKIVDPNNNWKDFVEKSKHVPHGRMTFKGAKMSSRLGGVPTAEEVLLTIKEVAKEKFTERSAGMNTNAFADMVAIAALKFSILKVAPGKPVNFDPEEALSFEGDSGPYIQYTYVRTQTLLEKGKNLHIQPFLHEHYIETNLERILYRFEEVAARAAEEYAPHYIAHYVLEVAQVFNSWYGNQKIVDESNMDISAHRLAVAQRVGIVLKRGLYLLGIETPDRM